MSASTSYKRTLCYNWSFPIYDLQEFNILDKKVGKGSLCGSASDCLIPCLLTCRRMSKEGNRIV